MATAVKEAEPKAPVYSKVESRIQFIVPRVGTIRVWRSESELLGYYPNEDIENAAREVVDANGRPTLPLVAAAVLKQPRVLRMEVAIAGSENRVVVLYPAKK